MDRNRAASKMVGAHQSGDRFESKKLDLLLKIRDNEFITWKGKYRPALNNQAIYPRPVQNKLPIWLGVGGTPESFMRASGLGAAHYLRVQGCYWFDSCLRLLDGRQSLV